VDVREPVEVPVAEERPSFEPPRGMLSRFGM
jgi:hypothetical protein